MARLRMPAPGEMSRQQAAVCDEVLSGARGRLPTPVIAWIQNPEMASHALRLGETLRFRTGLAPQLVELATLVCARHWKSSQVWQSHRRHALAAGLDEGIIEAIELDRTPALPDPTLRAAYDLATALLSRQRVPDQIYHGASDALGPRGVVELVAIVGYYCLVSLTANAFELGISGDGWPGTGERTTEPGASQ